MNDDTINFLRSVCAKIKEIATLCDTYLEKEVKKDKKIVATSQAEEPKSSGNRLIPLTKWNEYHSWPLTGGLRSLVFQCWKTGSDYFVRMAGRRVLICEKSFFEWANMTEEQRIKVSPAATRWREKYGKK